MLPRPRLHQIFLLTLLSTLALCAASESVIARSRARSQAPAPDAVKILTRGRVARLDTSPTAIHYNPENLFRGQGWRVWGSTPRPRLGAWISMRFDGLYYIKEIRFVPGDESDPSNFKHCGRPRTVMIESDEETRKIELTDRRYLQRLSFEEAVATQNLKLSFPRIYGRSRRGGVCLAKLEIEVYQDPLRAIPGLGDATEAALRLVSDPVNAARGLDALRELGSVVIPEIVNRLPGANPNQQRVLLQLIAELGGVGAFGPLQALALSAPPQLQRDYQLTLASLGDQRALSLLAREFPKLQGKRRDATILALLRSGHDRYEQLLLDGLLSLSVENLELLLPHFKGRYDFGDFIQLKLRDEKRPEIIGKFVRFLGSIDPKPHLETIESGLFHDAHEVRAGSILALKGGAREEIKGIIRNLAGSLYSVERRAAALTLSSWGEGQDLELLKELSRDRSLRVRQAALLGLSAFPETQPVLIRQAIYGSDETTAELAAKMLLTRGKEGRGEVAQSLLRSRFTGVRIRAAQLLLQREYCPLAIKSFFQNRKNKELMRAFGGSPCLTDLAASLKAAEVDEQIYLLDQLIRWRAKEALPLIQPLMNSPHKRVRARALTACILFLPRTKGIQLAAPMLKAPEVEIRDAAMIGLAQLKYPPLAPILSERLEGLSELEDPSQEQEQQIDFILKTISIYNQKEFGAVLFKVYKRWTRSLIFSKLRQRSIEVAGRLGDPSSIGLLLEAMSDPDPRLRRISERTLRQVQSRLAR